MNRLSMFLELAVSICICTVASISFIRRHHQHLKFPIFAFVNNGMWTPTATVHLLSYYEVKLATVSGIRLHC